MPKITFFNGGKAVDLLGETVRIVGKVVDDGSFLDRLFGSRFAIHMFLHKNPAQVYTQKYSYASGVVFNLYPLYTGFIKTTNLKNYISLGGYL